MCLLDRKSISASQSWTSDRQSFTMSPTWSIGSVALSLLLSSLPSADAHLQTRSNATNDVTATCNTLYNAYPDLTHFSNATMYTTLNEGMHLLSPHTHIT